MAKVSIANMKQYVATTCVQLFDGAGYIVLLPKLGESRAMELFLTGDTFDAKAAVAYGLLNAAAPEGRLDEVVDRYVASLLKDAPGAMAATNQLVRDLPRPPSMAMAFAETAELSERYFRPDKAREGIPDLCIRGWPTVRLAKSATIKAMMRRTTRAAVLTCPGALRHGRYTSLANKRSPHERTVSDFLANAVPRKRKGVISRPGGG